MYRLILQLFPVLLPVSLLAQANDSLANKDTAVNDTLYGTCMLESFEFQDPVTETKMEWKEYRLTKIYPYAEYAVKLYRQLEKETRGMTKRRKIKKAAKPYYKKLKNKFKYVVRDMTVSEGHMLMKLIYYMTGKTVYKVMAKYRGKFRAGFWQTLAKAWDQNLKMKFDYKKDWMLFSLIQKVENGEINVPDEAEPMSREEYKAQKD